MLWALDLTIPQGLKLLLVALASFANDDGTDVFPSVGTLAKMTSTEPRSVQRGLARLRALGLVKVETAGGGFKRATHYRIIRETLTPASPFQPAERVTSVQETLTLTTENPDASVTRIVNDSLRSESLPLPPSRAKGQRSNGRRSNGTSPRATGANARAQGLSPRQRRQDEKRGGAEALGSILARLSTRPSGPNAVDPPAADNDTEVRDGPFLDGERVSVEVAS